MEESGNINSPYVGMSSNKLVKLFQETPSDSVLRDQVFAELYARFHATILKLCFFRFKNNHAAAEDLAQDVFLRVFTRLDSFRGDSEFATWLYRLALNAIGMRFRKKELPVSSLDGLDVSDDGLSDYFGAPDRRLAFTPERLTLMGAIEKLPPVYRAVTLLRLQDHTHSEIANVSGRCDGASKKAFFMARGILGEVLRPYVRSR